MTNVIDWVISIYLYLSNINSGDWLKDGQTDVIKLTDLNADK